MNTECYLILQFFLQITLNIINNSHFYFEFIQSPILKFRDVIKTLNNRYLQDFLNFHRQQPTHTIIYINIT